MVKFCRSKIVGKFDFVWAIVQKAKEIPLFDQGPKRHFLWKRTGTALSKMYPSFGSYFGSSRAASQG